MCCVAVLVLVVLFVLLCSFFCQEHVHMSLLFCHTYSNLYITALLTDCYEVALNVNCT